jgi:hypothetical protein
MYALELSRISGPDIVYRLAYSSDDKPVNLGLEIHL